MGAAVPYQLLSTRVLSRLATGAPDWRRLHPEVLSKFFPRSRSQRPLEANEDPLAALHAVYPDLIVWA
jgi:hypothetical protein